MTPWYPHGLPLPSTYIRPIQSDITLLAIHVHGLISHITLVSGNKGPIRAVHKGYKLNQGAHQGSRQATMGHNATQRG